MSRYGYYKITSGKAFTPHVHQNQGRWLNSIGIGVKLDADWSYSCVSRPFAVIIVNLQADDGWIVDDSGVALVALSTLWICISVSISLRNNLNYTNNVKLTFIKMNITSAGMTILFILNIFHIHKHRIISWKHLQRLDLTASGNDLHILTVITSQIHVIRSIVFIFLLYLQ